MSSLFDSRLPGALRQIIGEFGEPVQYSSQTAPAQEIQAIIEDAQRVDPNLQPTAIAMCALWTDFAAAPVPNDTAVIRGSSYVAIQVTKKPTDPGVTIVLSLVRT